MTLYFNENDKFAAQWLRNLWPDATIDERDIRDVKPADAAGFYDAISSAGSAAGNMHCTSQDGPAIEKSGPGVVLANRFRTLANAAARTTNGTSGLNSIASSASADLQRCLESRLHQTTDLNGSTEYRLIWKKSVTPSRRLICRLRASNRPSDDNGSSGWPTPDTTCGRGPDKGPGWIRPSGANRASTLNRAAWLAGWPTPQACEAPNMSTTRENGRESRRITPQTIKSLAGWVSPTAQDHSRGNRPPRPHDTGVPLSQQVLAGWSTPQHCDGRGATGPSSKNRELGRDVLKSNAATESIDGLALNPAMSRWLMGYPATWDAASPNYEAWQRVQDRIASDACADTATP